MAAFPLARQLTASQGDGLSLAKKNCFCLAFTDDTSNQFMRLGCGCVLHYHCLVQYLQHRMRDRIGMSLQGISCPYGAECKSFGSNDGESMIYHVTLDDLTNIVDYGSSHPDLRQYLDDIGCEALTHEQVNSLKEWIAEQNDKPVKKYTDDDYELFIISTSKACPACGYRSTHYYGHQCHHIKCPNCHVNYCYKCLASEVENMRDRGKTSQCRCERAYWVSFCAPVKSKVDIAKYIVVNEGGIPYDNRCGCVVCSDCRYQHPCEFCPGDCSVCMGYVNPSPNEISQAWDPNGCKAYSGSHMNLWDCCRHGNTEELTSLLGTISDEDLYRKDREGRNAMHYAIDADNIEIVRLLIDIRGFELNVPCSRYNETPLLWATRNNNTEISRLLVERGADIDAKGLYYTIKNGDYRIVSSLLFRRIVSNWLILTSISISIAAFVYYRYGK